MQDGSFSANGQNLPHGGSVKTEHAQTDVDSFDPIRLFWLVLGYRWLIVGFVAFGVLLGIVYTSTQTPMYRSSIKVEILGASTGATQDLEVIGESRLSRIAGVQNAATKLRTRTLARRVVYALGLTEKPEFYQPQPTFSLSNIIRRALGQPLRTANEIQDAQVREDRAIRRVVNGLSATTKRQSSIVTVTFVHPSKEFTHLVVNQVGQSFIELNIDQKVEASRKVRTFIQEQVAVTKDQLTEAERNLNTYAKSINFAQLGEEPSLLISRIASVNDALNKAVQDRLETELIVSQVAAGKAVSLPEVVDNRAIQTLKSKVAELQVIYQEKLGVYKPDFPEMVQLRSQITELRSQLSEEIAIISESFSIRLQQIIQREGLLRQELQRLAGSQQEYREQNVEYTILKREVDSKRAQYASLVAKMNAIGVGSELRNAEASVLDKALPAQGPYSPRQSLNIAIFVMIALGLAGIAIYVLQLLHNTITVPDQIEEELDVPLLGIIPFAEAAADPMTRDDDQDEGAFDEAYRSLRTAVQFSAMQTAIPSIAVTSSEPSEGKSITAYKLAEGFALLGKKVLLIDADLRRPKLHKWLNQVNTLGLSTLLSQSLEAEDEADLFLKSDVENLTFLSAGPIPPNAADLLASDQMVKLIHKTQKEYDLVVIDTPPVMGLADAPVITRHTGATLFVVATRQSSRNAVRLAHKRLSEGGANVIGAVLTKFRLSKFDYNYAYTYMQNSYYTYEKEG